MAELAVLEVTGVILLVMYFSDDYAVLICEVQRGCEGVRVIGRREISALEGTDLCSVLEKCSLCFCCVSQASGKNKGIVRVLSCESAASVCGEAEAQGGLVLPTAKVFWGGVVAELRGSCSKVVTEAGSWTGHSVGSCCKP